MFKIYKLTNKFMKEQLEIITNKLQELKTDIDFLMTKVENEF